MVRGCLAAEPPALLRSDAPDEDGRMENPPDDADLDAGPQRPPRRQPT